MSLVDLSLDDNVAFIKQAIAVNDEHIRDLTESGMFPAAVQKLYQVRREFELAIDEVEKKKQDKANEHCDVALAILLQVDRMLANSGVERTYAN